MSDALFSSPEHQMFRTTVRNFVEQELRPRAREFDEQARNKFVAAQRNNKR